VKHFSAPHEPILLTAPLQPHQERHWPSANKEVIWGWKRDVGSESRLVYFSGNLARDGGSVILNRYFFHLRTRIALRADLLIGDVERACARFASSGAPTALKIEKQTDLTTIEVRIGWPTEIDGERVGRLKLRRPRKRIGVPEFPKASDPLRARSMWPADLYVGSGLSYEAGLPTLCDMHEVFAVDNETSTGFMVGGCRPSATTPCRRGIRSPTPVLPGAHHSIVGGAHTGNAGDRRLGRRWPDRSRFYGQR